MGRWELEHAFGKRERNFRLGKSSVRGGGRGREGCREKGTEGKEGEGGR